jgi:hypothetical protein
LFRSPPAKSWRGAAVELVVVVAADAQEVAAGRA